MFRPGEHIFIPGASGEPTGLAATIFAAENLRITTSFAPGVNRLDSEMIGAGTQVTGLFMQPGLAAAQRDGRFRHLPLSYGAMFKFLREEPEFNACVIQVTPPDARGQCSLGPVAEFTPEIIQRAQRIVAVINLNVPYVPNAPKISYKDFAQVVEAATPIVSYVTGSVDNTSAVIAKLLASKINDGVTLQTGLGKIPQALMAALTDRRNLRVHSGMISDGIIDLFESGALDPASNPTTTAILGSPRLYDWVRDRDDIHVRGVAFTHNPAQLAAIEKFVAVNSALEVDLFGQCNLELAGSRAISGVGGAIDFAHAAKLSSGGLSIVALPATFGSKKGSRIRARLGVESIVSLPRSEVDMVVTEEGIADLRGLSVHDRAHALIAIAAPDARADLADEWSAIAARL